MVITQEKKLREVHTSYIEFILSKITSALRSAEFSKDFAPFTCTAIQTLSEQLPDLLKKIEIVLSENTVGEQDDQSTAEDDLERLITNISECITSLDALLSRKQYQFHPVPKYKQRGIFIKKKKETQTESIAAFQIQFNKLSLSQETEKDVIGSSYSKLLQYLIETNSHTKKVEEIRQYSEKNAQRIVQAWQTESTKATEQKRQAGLTVKFGKMGKDGIQPFGPYAVTFEVQIRYHREHGLYFVPIIHLENDEIIARKLTISATGKAVFLEKNSKLATEANQEKINQHIPFELKHLLH